MHVSSKYGNIYQKISLFKILRELPEKRIEILQVGNFNA